MKKMEKKKTKKERKKTKNEVVRRMGWREKIRAHQRVPSRLPVLCGPLMRAHSLEYPCWPHGED